MSSTDQPALAQPERGQLLVMLENFERTLLGEAGEVRKMIQLVRNGGYPPEEIISDLAGEEPPAP